LPPAAHLTGACLARLRSQDEVVVSNVPDIQPAPSGKYRPVIGKLAEELLANRKASS